MADEPNAVARMLGALGDEWTLLIVQQALLGARRYADFAAALPISAAVLSARLQSMTSQELLSRREYQRNPPRSEYLTTARSRALWPMLTSIWSWERTWVAEHTEPLPAMRHVPCGQLFAPRVICRSCATAAFVGDVTAEWGPTGLWQRSIPVSANRRRTRRTGAGLLFPQTMSVIGDRWGFAILVAAFLGVSRFTDFQQHLSAPPNTTSARLANFTAEGILEHRAGRYRLTEKGQAFFPVLVCALEWAQRWFASPDGPAVVLTHASCGHRFSPALHCDRCEGRIRGIDVSVIADPP